MFIGISHKVCLCTLFLLAGTQLHADIGEDVTYLASEVCGGRKTGTVGAVEASWYIMERFREIGYEPGMEAFDNGDEGGAHAVGHNIVCENSGKGPAIVIMSHYDGFGTADGKLYPGADANASGVAGLLHLAEKLKGCERHIIFAAVDGHHNGMSGAKALKQRLGHTKIRMVLNLETLGSDLAPVKSYYKSYLIVLGGESYRKGLDAASRGLSLKLYFDYYGSREFTRLFHRVLNDQAPFLEAGIPSLMFTSGVTANSGSPADLPQTLNYKMLSERLALIEKFIIFAGL